MSDETTMAEGQLKALQNLIGDYESRMKIRISRGTLVERVERVVSEAERRSKQTIHQANDYRDTTIRQLEAMRIAAQTISMATDHRSKDVRVEGFIDVIDVAIDNLRDVHFIEMGFNYWPSVFGSDRSRTSLQRQVWELEQQVKDLKAGKVDDVADDDSDGIF